MALDAARTTPLLLANAGCGSAIVEAMFDLSGVAYDLEMVDPWTEGASKERLRAVNPLLQVPTLLLPDGSVMTESAAMILLAADWAPHARLVPGAGDPDRAPFLRWLVYLVGAIYPTFTYADDPSRYVPGEAAQQALQASIFAQRQAMWRQFESAAIGPWFLGARLSAIDVYVWAMVRWRPRRAWFVAEAPKLAAIAVALDGDPRMAAVKARNFP